MKNIFLATAALAAAISLGACKQETEIVDSRAPDPLAEAKKNAPKVELPPAIKASVTLRCRDNSLVYVDFFQGDKLANLRTERGGTAVQLRAENAGDPLTAEGYSMTGTPASVTLTQPGKPAQVCRV